MDRVPVTSAVLALLVLGATDAAAQLPPATTGDLLVSSSGNDRLLRLAWDGAEVASHGLPTLSHPRGIVVAPDDTVFLVSQNTNEVLVLDRRLRLLRRFPTTGVSAPTGAALGPGGNLFVAGFSSSNVGEFAPDGTPLGTYSGGGLLLANCVAFLPGGDFLVASAGTGRVVRFDSGGSPRSSFTGYGLASPMGIAVYGAEVFVAGGASNNIAVFDLSGQPLREIRHPDISGPQGVAFTAGGLLTTSGFYNDKVSWFRPDGTHVRTAEPPTASVPRSLAYLPSITLGHTGAPTPGVPFPMEVRSPFEPGLPYAAALSLSSTPGITLPGGRVLALTPDPLFTLSLSNAPAFGGFVGILDAAGRAPLTLLLPNVPGVAGLRIWGAAVTLDPGWPGLFRQVGDPVSWTL